MSTSGDGESRGPSGYITHNQLVRSLSLFDILMVGIAAMIGGSIFVLTGTAIGLAGSAVIVAFIINAIITHFTAMAYAELGSAIPEAGGGYLWVREGLPRPNAFISGWMVIKKGNISCHADLLFGSSPILHFAECSLYF